MGGSSVGADLGALDLAVRAHIYDRLFAGERMPPAADTARALGRGVDEVREAFRRMKEGRVLVLQEGDSEVLMANPFSAVPTPFMVEADGKSWWGNCIWDALGIAAMTRLDARITATCGDCNDEMVVLVEGGAARFREGEGIIHFSVPPSRWWANIKFT